MAETAESPSLRSLGGKGSWDNLPPSEPVTLPPAVELPEDRTEDVPAGTCATCREPIIREPGARGRMPKYHPDCRPLKSTSARSVLGVKSSDAKADKEAELAVAAFQKQVTQVAVMLSILDRFDAFCLMVALPQISENLKGVLVRYEWLRKEFLRMQTGGSVFGLVLALMMPALAIAAHHGFLGRGQTAKLLVEMPFTMLRIQERLKEGTAALTKLMEEQLRAAREANAPKPAPRTEAADDGNFVA